MTRLIYLWHRRLALLLLLPLLAFSLSGLLHPAMRLLRPEPAKMFYPAPQWPDSLPAITADIHIQLPQQLSGLRPVKVGQEWLLQSWQNRTRPAGFFNAETGQPILHANRDYAEQLARFFSGDPDSSIREISFITEFGDGYNKVNRLLPVWRVSFERDDQLQVYVDIRNDRLATLNDATRLQLMQWFSWLHSWSFMDESDLRTALFIGMMAASALLGGAGIWLFIVLPISKRRNSPLRKVHAVGGLLISLALLMFTLSGLVRSFEKTEPEIRGLALDLQIAPQSLRQDFATLQQRFSGLNDIRLQQFQGRPAWQLMQPRKPDIWVDSASGLVLADGEHRFATELAAQLLPQPSALTNSRRITSYKADPGYGFIDKRLPVTALDYGSTTLYVDTKDRVISKLSSPLTQGYSWIFRYLHKWRFADGLGKNGRDAVISLFILLISAVSLLGLAIWWRRLRKRRLAISAAPASLTQPASSP